MSSSSTSPAMRGRSLSLVATALHLGFAIALLTLAVGGASALLPVAITVRASDPGTFATVDLAAAAAIVTLVSVVCRLLAAWWSRGPRARALWYLEFSQMSGITLFLIAQLNGITEAGTLILCYGVGAGIIAVLWAQSRTAREIRSSAWPLSAAAVIAIVPWGIVALYQVTALASSAPLSPLVRVMTVVVLVLFVALWWIERRWQLGRETDGRVDVLRIAATVGISLSLLVLTVGLARPSALL